MNENFNGYHKPTYFTYKITILQAILFFIITLFLGQIVAGIITVPTLFRPELSALLYPLSFLVGFGSVVFVLIKILDLDLNEIKNFLHTKINIKYAILAIVLYLVALPLAEYMTMLVPMEGHPLLEKLYKFFEESMKIILEQKVAAFIMVCILAPILEEFIFRGIILRGLLHNGTNPWFAVIFTAFLFGLAHMNPWQLMGAGVLGFIFGFVYWRTQSLWLCIFLHFLNNLIAYIVSVINNNLEETVFEPNYLLLTASVILSAGLIWYLLKATSRNEIKPIEEVTPLHS